jgi:RNA-directed DNA polymerase
MGQTEPERLGRAERQKLVMALKIALAKCPEHSAGEAVWRDMLYEAELGLVPADLNRTRNLLKAIAGYDPLGEDTRPEGAKTSNQARKEARRAPSLQDLRRKIYIKAKAEKAKRFWGLYVHVTKLETLHEAYHLAKRNNGAPGIDGVTFADIEARGVATFLEEIRDELLSRKYRPMRNRRKEIPKGADKVRVLGIPTIRDRVVQGALKLILEPIFEADFQPGSFGYRPRRTAHEAVNRVAEGILKGLTRVLDLDLKAYFDNVRHHILLEKVAQRVNDEDVMRLLKLILTAAGKRGVPQGGVISPLLSNIYLNEVDRMLERAKEVTRNNGYTPLEYARYADDMVILVNASPQNDWLLSAVRKRLWEELAKLQVEVNEEKTRLVDLAARGDFGFLGFKFRRIRSRSGKWRPSYIPQLKKRTALLRDLKEIFRNHRSQPVPRVIERINPKIRGWVNYFRIGNSSHCFSYIRDWVDKKIRRHMMRARKRRGFGWKRWSSRWIEENLPVYRDYRIRYYTPPAKALPRP